MAEEQSTHVIFKGRHYILPGKLGSQEAFLRVSNLTGAGPKIQKGTQETQGFEDTSADAAAILERRHEPNRARDIAPRLALFTAQGAMAAQLPGAAEGIGAWVNALRGASNAAKAGATAKAAGTLVKEGAKFYAADQGMKAVGVPGEIRTAVLATAGVTRPGEAARRSLRTLIKGEAEPAIAAVEAAAAPRVVAEEVAAPVASAPAPVAAPAAPLPAGQRTMPTNLGGAARPGPAPTPPEKLEEALQATLDAIKKEKAAAGSLQPERIEIGAQKLGRKVGMTKEQVRMEAGPVLDEARGEASPLLPKQAYASIAEKIKTLPKGEARDAYVALANSEKAMLSVEAIRRTLETQGLVLPFAAVAGLVIKAQSEGRE